MYIVNKLNSGKVHRGNSFKFSCNLNIFKYVITYISKHNRQVLVFILLIYGLTGKPQVPNVHLLSTDGTYFDLYNTLDSGKIVVLDFFAVNCGHCQVGTPTLNDYWIDLLKKGELGWVWAIESSKVDNKQVKNFLETYGGTYPGFSTIKNDSVLSHDYGYGIDYTPQYYLVKPDRSAELLNLESLRDSIVSYFSDTVGIDKFNNFDFQIFYSDGQLHLFSKNYINIDCVDVYNVSGIKVKRCIVDSVGKSEYSVDFHRFNPGIYIVNIAGNRGTVATKKIFISGN